MPIEIPNCWMEGESMQMLGIMPLRPTPRPACFNHPAVDGGMIHVDATFFHEFFDVTRAQRIGQIPTDSHENDLRWEMGTFEAHRHRPSPS